MILIIYYNTVVAAVDRFSAADDDEDSRVFTGLFGREFLRCGDGCKSFPLC